MRAAEATEETSELERRYQVAIEDAVGRGTADALREFEAEIENSRAVLARSANELQRLATSDKEVYASYYALLRAGLISHTGDRWSLLRALADESLFPGYKEEIRFAALTLDMEGLLNYGNCFIVPRTEMIAHRASVFEENSAMFMKHHRIQMSEADNLPRGYRATWHNRGKLCVAKLSKRIDAETAQGEYSQVLLRRGATTAEDDFVEVHIWGPMTARTFEQISIKLRAKRPAHRAIISALKESLEQVSVKLQVS